MSEESTIHPDPESPHDSGERQSDGFLLPLGPEAGPAAVATISGLLELASSQQETSQANSRVHANARVDINASLRFLKTLQQSHAPGGEASSLSQVTLPLHATVGPWLVVPFQPTFGQLAPSAPSLNPSVAIQSDSVDPVVWSTAVEILRNAQAHAQASQSPIEAVASQIAYMAGYMSAFQTQNPAPPSAMPLLQLPSGSTAQLLPQIGGLQVPVPGAEFVVAASPSAAGMSLPFGVVDSASRSPNGRQRQVQATAASAPAAEGRSSISPRVNSSLLETVRRGTFFNETFPERLYRMLEEVARGGNDDIISFSSDGKAFEIHRPDAFVDEIIPLYFRHGRFSSFRRQLSMYGFKRLDASLGERVYAHELFVRGKPELLSGMKRVGDPDVKKGSSSKNQPP